MRIKSLPDDERPIEKTLFNGVDKLSNAELIAVLLGSGTKEKSAIGLAEEIISISDGGISHLSESSAEELMNFNGVGKSKAVRILAAVELGKRISTKPKDKRSAITSAKDAADLFMEELRYEKREYFKAVLVNAKAEIISIETISIGELSSAPIHPREVFNPAVKKSACAVLFVHNHPSGDPRPSEQDIQTTARLLEAGKILGISVLDHIIIGDGIYASLQELGYL